MQKRWTVKKTDAAIIQALHSQLKINTAICTLLAQRNISDYATAKKFFRPQLNNLYAPTLIRDMDIAVRRIIKAINQKEKILLVGDYDVDGTTSVALLYNFLFPLHSLIDYHIPDRYSEGYGLSKKAVEYCKQNEIGLLITLDCGIKNAALIALANEYGVDTIVCDHHIPDENLPPALAILNPKQNSCTYPFKELSGCGISFKFAQAIAEKLGLPEEKYLSALDLVALSIAADIVPLVDENRTLAFWGLAQINQAPSLAFKTFFQLLNQQQPIDFSFLIFQVSPRINAAGRMGDAKRSVQIFVEKKPETILFLATQIFKDNEERKLLDKQITEEAIALIENDIQLSFRKALVVYQPHWHHGIVGIVASRLVQNFHKPSLVITKKGDKLTGSARSVEGFDVHESITACSAYLLHYGGHQAAAGFSLEEKNLPIFIQHFQNRVEEKIENLDTEPRIMIDVEIDFSQIGLKFYNLLKQMEPFGPENPTPIFLSKNVLNTGYSKVVKEKHLKLSLQQNEIILSGIAYNLADKIHLLYNFQPMDIIYHLQLNRWNGNENLELQVLDIHPSK